MEALRRLLVTADVLVENYRPTVLEEMGLGFDELKRIKPDIIVCSISGMARPALTAIVRPSTSLPMR